MHPLVYGLDFGTSNSAVSILDKDTVTLLPVGAREEPIVRSVLFFPEGKHTGIVGRDAIREYIASGMNGRFISSFKSMPPISLFSGTSISGKLFTPEQIVATFLFALKAKADRIVGKDVRSIVLGRPAVFSPHPAEERLAVNRLTEAARLAGFEQIRFQLEPIAAALNYESTITKEELVFVADLGGGTSDFTVMRVSPHKRQSTDRSSDILASGGVSVGGDIFSSGIMREKLIKYFGSEVTYRGMTGKTLEMPLEIKRTICDWKKIPYLKDHQIQRNIRDILPFADDKPAVERLQTLINDNLGFSVFEAIESAKQGLSDRQAEKLEYHRQSINLLETITRKEYESMIRRELEQITFHADQTLERSQIKPGEITTVFLTGGTSKTPVIQRLFSEKFPGSRIVSSDAFLSVAAGLARSIPLFEW